MSSFVVLFLTSQYMPIQCVYLEDLATFISTSELVQYFHCTSNLKFEILISAARLVWCGGGTWHGNSFWDKLDTDLSEWRCASFMFMSTNSHCRGSAELPKRFETWYGEVSYLHGTKNANKSGKMAQMKRLWITIGNRPGQHWGANFSRSLEAWNLEQNNEDRDNWNRKHNFDKDKESTDSTNGY